MTTDKHRTIPVAAIGDSDAAPAFIAPEPASLFTRRAERLEALANGHALGDWLRFMASLCRAQQSAQSRLPELSGPEASALAQARAHAMPPLAIASYPRDPAWLQALRDILTDLDASAPAPVQAAIARLRAADAQSLDRLAAQALESAADPALQPLLAAALQVVWSTLAAIIGDEIAPPSAETAMLCPCCGTPAVASVIRVDGECKGQRYLHCPLCNSQWSHVRATCTTCGEDKQVALQRIEGGSEAARAETCDACHAYLKIFYPEHDAGLDPVADDLATLALDLLVDEAGYARSGPNLLLASGS